MLSPEEWRLVYDYGYLPEHLPDYVAAVSEQEPFLHKGYLCYARGGHLTFVGYPLLANAPASQEAFESACRRFNAETVSLMAPHVWLTDHADRIEQVDEYFRLELTENVPKPGRLYMTRRAAREISVHEAPFSPDHHRMTDAFCESKGITGAARHIYGCIPSYLGRSGSAFLLEATKGGMPVAFIIVDAGAAQYGFYMFSIRSPDVAIPGTSDLLFREMTERLRARGKTYVNLGLGVNEGIRRFKEEWGGVAFLSHESVFFRRKRPGFFRLLLGK